MDLSPGNRIDPDKLFAGRIVTDFSCMRAFKYSGTSRHRAAMSLLTECAGPCDIDRVSRGMNTLVPLLISLGRDFMKWIGIAVLILSSLFLTAQDVQKKEPPVLGPHRVRGAGHGKAGGGSPDLIYHGGPILPSITIRA